MFEQVKQYAMEKFAGDESAVADFMDSFSKEVMTKEAAKYIDDANKTLGNRIVGGSSHQETTVDNMLKGFTGEMGKSLGGMAIGLGATALGTLYNSARDMNLYGKHLQALLRAYEANPILKETPKEKVKQYAETIFKFAPNVATDSNLLSSILANAIHGEGIDPMTIKTLTELEASYKKNTTFSPKTYV